MSAPTLCGRCGVLLEKQHDARGARWVHVSPSDHTPVLGTPVADAEAIWAAQRERNAPAQVSDEVAAHPAPEVPARIADESEIPKTLLTLMRNAALAGWEVTATYARGTPIGADGLPMTETRDEVVIDGDSGEVALTPTGKPKVRKIPVGHKVIDSVAVRLSHPDGRRFVVCYEDGKTACAYRVRPWTEATNVTSIKKEITR